MFSIYEYFLGLNKQRERLLAKAPEGPLKAFLSVPFPEKGDVIGDVELLALDFETTGLNPKADALLSVGYVTLQRGIVRLNTCHHEIIQSPNRLDKDNVVIHQITDTEKANGERLEDVVANLLNALAGKIMLVHYAQVETTFLAQACKQLYGMAPVLPVIDTLVVSKRRFDLRDTAYDPSQLRLTNLRHSYQLPAHHEHNALNDAIATAELLLAQLQHFPDHLNTPIKDFLC